MELGEQIATLREEKTLTQVELAEKANISPSTLSQIESGRVPRPHVGTVRKIARALGVEPAELRKASPEELTTRPKVEPPLPDFEERRAAEPLSPKMRRFAASMRRAHLEHIYEHLTLRLEALLEQAKTYFEAGDRPGLWTVFMDASTLPEGAKALLAEMREEAQNFGGETEKERRLGGRIEHRIEDFEEASEKIGDMWKEILDAENEAENDRHPSPGNRDELQAFKKRRAG
jgi:transcriptional regulator with XRE-family HTH domain